MFPDQGADLRADIRRPFGRLPGRCRGCDEQVQEVTAVPDAHGGLDGRAGAGVA
jgi:hypothetical protein